jgi:hypothetical protein
MRASVGGSLVAALILPTAFMVGGCGTPPPTTAPVPNPPPEGIIEPQGRPPEVRPGLVVERLRIRADGDRLRAALASIPESSADPAESERWRREGFLVRLIDEEMLAAFEASLEPDVIAVRTWHGEATGWRSAARRRLPRGSVLLIDGRARPIDERLLTLAVRGWSVPLVDGAGVQIEVVPHLEATTIDPLSPPPPPGEFRGVPLVPAIERVLRPGEVLLVASVQDRRVSVPSMSEGDPGRPASAGSSDPPEDGSRSSDPVPGPSPGPGPEGGLPPTVAACLVGEPIVGELGVMLFRGRPHPAVDLPTSTSAE